MGVKNKPGSQKFNLDLVNKSPLQTYTLFGGVDSSYSLEKSQLLENEAKTAPENKTLLPKP